MLHTINKSPFDRNSLASCLRTAPDGGAILFIEDGVYATAKGTTFSGDVEGALKNQKVFVLGPDLAARGIAEDKLIDGISVVDYGGFVDLVEEFGTVQSWL